MTENTCSKCAHYRPTIYSPALYGTCELAGDYNDLPSDFSSLGDRMVGYDHEGYRAGVYVGPEFGCIHWAKKP